MALPAIYLSPSLHVYVLRLSCHVIVPPFFCLIDCAMLWLSNDTTTLGMIIILYATAHYMMFSEVCNGGSHQEDICLDCAC